MSGTWNPETQAFIFMPACRPKTAKPELSGPTLLAGGLKSRFIGRSSAPKLQPRLQADRRDQPDRWVQRDQPDPRVRQVPRDRPGQQVRPDLRVRQVLRDRPGQ